MITDCYPVGIFSKIIDNRLCTIESFFTVSDPVLFITLIKKFFKTIAVLIFLCCTMKFKLRIIPQAF